MTAEQIDRLGSDLRRVTHAVDVVPGLLLRVWAEDAWRTWKTPAGETIEHTSFDDFVTAPEPYGLGSDLRTLRRLTAHHAEATALLSTLTGSGKLPPPA